jgi:hypothetical protein
MADISIQIDSVKGTIDVSVDGKKLQNINSVSAYKYKPYDSDEELVDFSAMSYEKSDDSGLMKHTMWALRGGETASEATCAGIKVRDTNVENLVSFLKPQEPDLSKVHADIAEFFKS